MPEKLENIVERKDDQEGTAALLPAGEVKEEIIEPDQEPADTVDLTTASEESGEPPLPLPDFENVVESIIFAADEPLSAARIKSFIAHGDVKKIREAVKRLNKKYDELNFSFKIVEVAGGFQFASRPAYSDWVAKLYKDRIARRLSESALETLAIIAYKGPITRLGVANIRGVSADGVIKTLLERKLITIAGTGEGPGKPMLYGVTKEFYKYFGINGKEELPNLKEFEELSDEQAIKQEGDEEEPQTAMALPNGTDEITNEAETQAAAEQEPQNDDTEEDSGS